MYLNLNPLTVRAHGLCRSTPAFEQRDPAGLRACRAMGRRRHAADLDLFSADTFELSGDVRLVAVDGERSWVDGGFGKLRSGSDGDSRPAPARQRQPGLEAAIHLVAGRRRRRLGPGRRAHRGRAQPGLSDLPADARRQGRFLRARRADVAASQPRARRRRLARQGFDHAVGDQQLDRRGSAAGRARRARSPRTSASTSSARPPR